MSTRSGVSSAAARTASSPELAVRLTSQSMDWSIRSSCTAVTRSSSAMRILGRMICIHVSSRSNGAAKPWPKQPRDRIIKSIYVG
ncbi:MAG TPA: hypothetical protein VLM75_11745 [Spirochaetota bacterium]|nr:hypothetical protein [Spirochaetota bacterium]